MLETITTWLTDIIIELGYVGIALLMALRSLLVPLILLILIVYILRQQRRRSSQAVGEPEASGSVATDSGATLP